MNSIKINGTEFKVMEYKGQRVVTLAQVDSVHGRAEGTARRNFNANKERLIEGEDYVKLSANEIRTRFPGVVSERTTEDVTVLTESGYLMLVKSFTDDLAWNVQRQLVNSYFRQHPAPAVLTPGEMLLASAQAFVEVERQLAAQKEEQAAIKVGMMRMAGWVEELAESRVWDHCPQNCEPISKIRDRINARYGLPSWVIDQVMWRLPLSPKPHGMVRNQREEAKGSQYEVYAVADITRIFATFVSECVIETPMRASHRDIDKSFQLLLAGKQQKPLKAHAPQNSSYA